jgi:hypothetical protein
MALIQALDKRFLLDLGEGLAQNDKIHPVLQGYRDSQPKAARGKNSIAFCLEDFPAGGYKKAISGNNQDGRGVD